MGGGGGGLFGLNCECVACLTERPAKRCRRPWPRPAAQILATAPGDLWLVILSADPDHNPGAAGFPYVIGTANRSINVIDAGMFSTALTEQNDLRVSLDLPPLPEPVTVTHASPGR